MKNCYLIGGSGFIGRHLADLLLKTERNITIVGRKPVCDLHLPVGARHLVGNFDDESILREICCNADEIVLLAYSTVPKTSFDDPVQDIFGNLPSAVKLFEMASNGRLEKLVFVSSGGTVYGNPLATPMAENHPTTPISPYGITKLAIEKYAAMYHLTMGLPVICVRPANAYGEGQKPFSGQGFVATAMASVLLGREIRLFGEEGSVRDYIHVSDIARGILAVLERGRVGASYNIGSGIGYSNRDILRAIDPLIQAVNLRMDVKIFPKRSFDVSVNILDCGKIERETGWKTAVGLDQGMKRTWDWFWDNRSTLSPTD